MQSCSHAAQEKNSGGVIQLGLSLAEEYPTVRECWLQAPEMPEKMWGRWDRRHNSPPVGSSPLGIMLGIPTAVGQPMNSALYDYRSETDKAILRLIVLEASDLVSEACAELSARAVCLS
jgi:hypothetical protein